MVSVSFNLTVVFVFCRRRLSCQDAFFVTTLQNEAQLYLSVILNGFYFLAHHLSIKLHCVHFGTVSYNLFVSKIVSQLNKNYNSVPVSLFHYFFYIF